MKKELWCRNVLLGVAAVWLLITVSGCGARIADFTASTTKNFNVPLTSIEKGPRVSGEDCTTYLLGFIPLGHVVPDAREATDQALEAGKGTFLLDTVWDIENVWFIVATRTCLTVEGTAVTIK